MIQKKFKFFLCIDFNTMKVVRFLFVTLYDMIKMKNYY